jgi:hypothetical protein
MKPTNDKNVSTTNEAGNAFILASVFRDALDVRSHQLNLRKDRREPQSQRKESPKVRPHLCPHKTTDTNCHPSHTQLRRDLSTQFCRSFGRSGHSRRFVRRLRHRVPQSGSCNAGKPAPARGSRTRSCRRCDASRQRPLQTPCHIRFRKLRM